MSDYKEDKISRVLDIYSRLMDGYVIRKSEEAVRFSVNERSIQRDIDDIRIFLDNDTSRSGYKNEVIYDRDKKGFRLKQIYKIKLTNAEVLAVCKILLDSRAFTKKEMSSVLERLVSCCVPDSDRKLVADLIKNEKYYYVEPRHHKEFLDAMWDIGQAIRNCHYIEIKYQGLQGSTVKTRKLQPLAIMFSEYYFYLAAFINSKEVRQNFDVINDSFPTIYRIDRIRELKVLDENFHIPYANKFEEGEFRKRVQFMYGGKLQKLTLKYTGYDVDSILDRLPTATIIDEEDFTDEKGIERKAYTLKAEVFGKGIDMWIRSQGGMIHIIE